MFAPLFTNSLTTPGRSKSWRWSTTICANSPPGIFNQNAPITPSALVHEVYLKLAAQNPVDWQNKAHFFALAAQVMRHILVDYARTRQREKRGGAQVIVELDEALELSRPSE